MEDPSADLVSYAPVVSAAASVLMVIVWAVYLNLIYRGYRDARRPRIIIHQTPRDERSATYLLINMSQEPIHVQQILAEATLEGGRKVRLEVGDHQEVSTEEKTTEEIRWITKQGPLPQSGFLSLGTLDDLMRLESAVRVGEGEGEPAPAEVTHLELRVVALHGAETGFIGARRRFSKPGEGRDGTLMPESHQTEQLSSRRERREAARWLEEDSRPGEHSPASAPGATGTGERKGTLRVRAV